MTRCAIYARTSGDDTERDSIGSQVDECRQYASAKGWTVVEVFTEDERGISGARADRPALKDVLALASAGGIDILLCRDTARLAREIHVAYEIRKQLKDSGVELWTVWDGSAAGNKILDGMKVIMDDFVRDETTRRLQAGRRRSVENGSIFIGGPHQSPFGYTMIKDGRMRSLEIDQAQAVVIRDIFRWYGGGLSEPSLTLRAICKRLNDAGVPSPSGGKWGVLIVRRILKDEKFRGLYQYKSTSGTLTIDIPAIVSDDVWYAAQRRFTANKAERSGVRKFNYLVGNRATCGDCGHKMSGRMSGRYYKCNCVAESAALRSCECGNRWYYRVDTVDAAVWGYILKYLMNPGAVVETRRAQADDLERRQEPSRRQLATVEAAIERERAAMSRLLDLMVRGTWDPGMVEGKRQEIQTRLDALQRERDGLLDDLEAPAMTMEELEAVVELMRELSVRVKRLETLDEFSVRRRMVEALNLNVKLWRDDDGTRMMLITSRLNPIGEVVTL